MRKFIDKMRRVRVLRWNKLSAGEKVLKVLWVLLKMAVIAALIVVVGGIALIIVSGALIAMAIGSAVGGGLYNAGHAYRPGDHYVRFR